MKKFPIELLEVFLEKGTKSGVSLQLLEKSKLYTSPLFRWDIINKNIRVTICLDNEPYKAIYHNYLGPDCFRETTLHYQRSLESSQYQFDITLSGNFGETVNSKIVEHGVLTKLPLIEDALITYLWDKLVDKDEYRYEKYPDLRMKSVDSNKLIKIIETFGEKGKEENIELITDSMKINYSPLKELIQVNGNVNRTRYSGKFKKGRLTNFTFHGDEYSQWSDVNILLNKKLIPHFEYPLEQAIYHDVAKKYLLSK